MNSREATFSARAWRLLLPKVEPDSLIEEAVDRRLMLIIITGTALTFPMTLAKAIDQLGAVERWWTVSSWTLLVATVTIIASAGTSYRTIRAVWAGYSLLWLVVSVSWNFTSGPTSESAVAAPWTWSVAPMAVALATLRWNSKVAIGYAFAAPLSLLATSLLNGTGMSPELSSLTALHLGNAGFVVLLSAARAQLVQICQSMQDSAMRQRQLAIATSWRNETSKITALIHDEVLGTLTAASYAENADDPQFRTAVQQSIVLLENDAATTMQSDQLSATEFVDALRKLAAAADAITVVQDSSPDQFIPGSVVEAMLAATAEALRNSVQHAGVDGRVVNRWVYTDVTDGEVRIRTVDDGRGFDPSLTRPTRFGVRVSILDRMMALTGGEAAVRSAPGAGTEVDLQWRSMYENPWESSAVDPRRSTESEPSLSLANVSGLTSRATMIVLLFAWMLGLLWLARAWTKVDQPSFLAFAMMWMLISIVYVCRQNRHLPGRSVLMVASTPLVSGIAVCVQGASLSWQDVWLMQMSANLVALLAIRGKVLVACTGFFAQMTLMVFWAAQRNALAESMTLLAVPAATVVAGVVWHLGLQQGLAAIRAYRRTSEAAHFEKQAIDAAAVRAADLLPRVSGIALSPLEALNRGGAIELALQEQCRVAAATVRDVLRAPRLAVEPLTAACTQARMRGTEIIMLDDGDDTATISPEVIAQLSTLLREIDAERVTVRIPPPRRGMDVSVLIESADHVVRTTISRPVSTQTHGNQDRRADAEMRWESTASTSAR